MATHDDHDDVFGRCLPGDSFSRLLFEGSKSETGSFVHYPSPFLSSSDPTKRLLCFQQLQPQIGSGSGSSQLPNFTQNSTFAYSAVSLPPPGGAAGPDCSLGIPLKSHKKKKKQSGSGQGLEAEGSSGAAGAPIGGGTSCEKKKAKTSASSNAKRGKVRRQRLGGGIVALQQLVCPYGKSDAASVLHEAMGYIRFLQEQVKVLCFPYFQCQNPSSDHYCSQPYVQVQMEEGLRSKGLCLVPLDCIAHVDNNNGADLWSPSATSMSYRVSLAQQ
ncbi:hypothetical protein Dimus_025967 [Dionaea muscipula]